jgi:hypothetical protein
MSAAIIYVKTPKGIEEINNRSHGLSPRLRQALILLDGRRNTDEIALMLPDGESEALLTKLVDGGFVVPMQPVPKKETATDKPAAKIERPENDAERFEMAKHFMRNTINTFLGGMGSGLINQVDKCTNFDELRQLFGSWKEAIELSGDGRKQLSDLENRLAALLS